MMLMCQKYIYITYLLTSQGLRQREKVHKDCEKDAQINILINKIVPTMSQYYH